MQRNMALGLSVIAGISFGTAAIFIRLLSMLDSTSIAFARLFIGFLGLLVLLYFRREIKEFIHFAKSYSWKHIIMGALLGIHFIFFVASVQHTTVLNATIFVNTTPIQALIISVIFLKVKPSARDVFSVLLGFSGITLIALSEAVIAGSDNITGDIEALIAAGIIAVYLTIGADLRKETEALVLMTSNFLLGALVIFFYSLPVQGGIFIPLELSVILFLLGLGLIPTAIGHTLYVVSVKVLKPYEIATITLLEALSATILAAILFSEIPSLFSVVGAVLISIALLMLVRKKDFIQES